MKWQEIVEKADSFKETGQIDIYLDREDRRDLLSLPWEFVTIVEPWGSHRLDIDTGVMIRAQHPSGLTFRWSIDLESRGSNGSGHYHIDTKRIQQVMDLLPFDGRHQFQAYLTDCAEKMDKRSTEEWQYLQQQFRDAALLRKLGDARREREGASA